MRTGIITDADGWASYYAPCGCHWSVRTGYNLGPCDAHYWFVDEASTAADVLDRMKVWVKAEAREVAA